MGWNPFAVRRIESSPQKLGFAWPWCLEKVEKTYAPKWWFNRGNTLTNPRGLFESVSIPSFSTRVAIQHPRISMSYRCSKTTFDVSLCMFISKASPLSITDDSGKTVTTPLAKWKTNNRPPGAVTCVGGFIYSFLQINIPINSLNVVNLQTYRWKHCVFFSGKRFSPLIFLTNESNKQIYTQPTTPLLIRIRISKCNKVLLKNTWMCLRCLEKWTNIIPNGGLMVIYLPWYRVKTHLKQIQENSCGCKPQSLSPYPPQNKGSRRPYQPLGKLPDMYSSHQFRSILYGKLTWQWRIPILCRESIFIHGPFPIANVSVSEVYALWSFIMGCECYYFKQRKKSKNSFLGPG